MNENYKQCNVFCLFNYIFTYICLSSAKFSIKLLKNLLKSNMGNFMILIIQATNSTVCNISMITSLLQYPSNNCIINIRTFVIVFWPYFACIITVIRVCWNVLTGGKTSDVRMPARSAHCGLAGIPRGYHTATILKTKRRNTIIRRIYTMPLLPDCICKTVSNLISDKNKNYWTALFYD